jgi:hypothetical protein
MEDQIVATARKVHSRHWHMSGDEGTGDRLAKTITDEWQKCVLEIDSARFQREVQISSDLNERVDLLDAQTGVVYELKVSPNNPHLEFFRDIFKVVVLKRSNHKISKFVFLVPKIAADKLNKSLAGQILNDTDRFGFETAIVGL